MAVACVSAYALFPTNRQLAAETVSNVAHFCVFEVPRWNSQLMRLAPSPVMLNACVTVVAAVPSQTNLMLVMSDPAVIVTVDAAAVSVTTGRVLPHPLPMMRVPAGIAQAVAVAMLSV